MIWYGIVKQENVHITRRLDLYKQLCGQHIGHTIQTFMQRNAASPRVENGEEFASGSQAKSTTEMVEEEEHTWCGGLTQNMRTNKFKMQGQLHEC